MFRVKITGYKKGNISIGILIVLSVVLLNLIMVITAIVNMYRGTRVAEIQAYKDDRRIMEKSIKNDHLENKILSIVNDFAKDVKKDEKDLKETFTKFTDMPIESEEKYWLSYDKVFNEFFLYKKENSERKVLSYFVNEGKISLKFKKV